MKHSVRTSRRQRAGCALVAFAMLAAPVAPAWAVSGTSYTGYVSQLPGVYTTPPPPNVMFTFDDSGSMWSDVIPDLKSDLSGFPSANADTYYGGASFGTTFPTMWQPSSGFRGSKYYSIEEPIARFLRSSAGNPLYYNPKVRYRPWPKATNDKDFNANASVTSVVISQTDPFDTTAPRLDLTAKMSNGVWPAAYFVYDETKGALQAGDIAGTTRNTKANFTEYVIDGTEKSFPRGAERSDCTTVLNACTRTEELQNFANWLQYYRSRNLMAKGGVAAAFAKQAEDLRVGYGTINTTGVVKRGVAPFSSTSRSDFYTLLYASNGSGSTPLRKAMAEVGKYFQRTGAGNPWAEDPTNATSAGKEYTCRRSFHILSTDGFWNDSLSSTEQSLAQNADNDALSGQTPAKPDKAVYDYTDTAPKSTDPLAGRFSVSPFADNNTSARHTLADVAAYYWKSDLRPDLDNTVASSTRDPAYWQHLATYTVGLGVSGTGEVKRKSDTTAAVPAGESASSPFASPDFTGKPWLSTQRMRDLLIATKTALVWTAPEASRATTGDDLIHASMVGRGQYFSATNPADLAAGLGAALSEATDQPGDFASVAADAPQLRAGGKVYQAIFSPFRWYGRLYAFKQDATTGKVNNKPTDDVYTNPDQVWEASNKLPAPSLRQIYTSAGTAGTGTTFLWTNLTEGQKKALRDDPTLVDYLRGDSAREISSGGTFRDRARYTVDKVTGGVLGDIVNGSPVKGPDAGGEYDLLPTGVPGQSTYGTYRTGDVLTSLRSTIFFAANDGMLHAVSSDTGVERFAYVPNAVYSVPRSSKSGTTEAKLAMLSDANYAHRFTVDGPPNVSDAYLDGSWRTLLTASNGAGARGIYAMDVTDTVVGASGFGTGKLMWEFTEANSADMGFVPSYPHVAKMRDGTWAVILGNGYDSQNGHAKLYILNAATGAVLKEFTLGTSGDNNNGLGQPNFVLSQREVTTIYAGDLKGNLWKVDVSSTDPAKWHVAFDGKPLFTTPSVSGVPQPITVMPELETHPLGGVMVVFGTGKLFEDSDTATGSANVNLKTQSIYGIWDKRDETEGITASRETALQVQTASSVLTSPRFSTTSATVPDWKTKRGWYLDLTAEGSGERVSLAPQIVRKTLFVVANTPQSIPCQNGGLSRVFALDPVTGAAPQFAVFVTGNVQVNTNGVMTQPMFQFTGQAGSAARSSTGSLYGRGDATAARKGGFEPRATQPPCEALMTAAMANTTLSQSLVKLCQKRRISWRQLQ